MKTEWNERAAGFVIFLDDNRICEFEFLECFSTRHSQSVFRFAAKRSIEFTERELDELTDYLRLQPGVLELEQAYTKAFHAGMLPSHVPSVVFRGDIIVAGNKAGSNDVLLAETGDCRVYKSSDNKFICRDGQKTAVYATLQDIRFFFDEVSTATLYKQILQ